MNLVYMAAITAADCQGPNGSLFPIMSLIGTAVKIILIAIPIMLVIFGLIDLAKAVMAGEDKEIKAAQKMLIRRLIYTVVAFLFIGLVQAALGILVPDNNANANLAVSCLNAMFNS